MTRVFQNLIIFTTLFIIVKGQNENALPTFQNGDFENVILEEGSTIPQILKCSATNANFLTFRLNSTNSTLRSLGLQVLEPANDDQEDSDGKHSPEYKIKLINIPSSDKKYSGKYICTGRNRQGSSDKIFSVTFKAKKQRQGDDKSSSNNVIAGVSVTIVVVTLIIVWIFYEFFGAGKNGLTKEEIQDFLLGNVEAIRSGAYAHENANYMPYKNSYEVPKEKLHVEKKLLGSGQFGEVFEGLYKNQKVAVKTVKQGIDKMYLKSLLAELKIMIYLGKHANIVSLIGASTSNLAMGHVYIIVEICDLGSMEKYLRENKSTFLNLMDEFGQLLDQKSLNEAGQATNPLCTKDLILWSYQIANAMEYLVSKKVIHGDLAARNVLLSDKRTAKITDFGLSRQLYGYTPCYQKKNLEPLPWRWMAYESLRELTFSNKSDVWSFGVTLWEIFTLGDTPYAGLFWTTEFVESLANGYKLSKPKLMTHDLYCEILKTWNLESDKRPNFKDIGNFLQTYFEKFQMSSYSVPPLAK